MIAAVSVKKLFALLAGLSCPLPHLFSSVKVFHLSSQELEVYARGPFGHVWIWIPYEGKLCVMWEHVECEILLVCGSYNDGLV